MKKKSFRNCLGRKRLLLLIFLAGFAGCSRQPEKPLELQLTLAKRKIKAGEYLWYLIEMKNIGRKPIPIKSLFWKKQSHLRGSELRLEILDSRGEQVPMLSRPYGWHGEHHFWGNDCGGGVPCDKVLRYMEDYFFKIEGGETLTPTPSMVAPIRPRSPHRMFDIGDMRDLPETPKGWSDEKVEALRKSWKATVEGSGYLMGDPTFRSDPKNPAISQPKGYRVLDVYAFEPGKYRMRVVFHPLDTPEFVEKEFHQSFAEYLAEKRWPKETRVVSFESSWVEFEVEAVPFPEHLFQRNLKEKPTDRARTERLRKKLRESQPWKFESNPPPVKRKGAKP